ncbi:MAG: 4-aminobutyrate aminotransferase / (S)-3-amino-2-methylpropionate transaminase / 5-aminovalerate [Frankiaceae bacterium]|nr:4-aminobutyrate aminotransferase / (S)-3-amino-2-methylpropionate transaminase / 5-aminovalerate [Frankiaceae bacterium]
MDERVVPQQRRLVTEVPGPRSRELMARRHAALPTGVGATLPVFAARAQGGIVEDVDGNRFVDFAAGIAVTTVGSSAPRVVEAVSDQLSAFTHTCFQVTPYESYVAVCEALNRLTPGDHEKRSFLVNSGAEAVENAVKVARYSTGRSAVVAFDHGFHGRTLLGMTLTGKVMPYKQGFGPFAPEVYRAPYSYPYRGTGDLPATLSMLEKTVGASNIACVVVEPIAGEGGFIVPAPGWLQGLAAWCSDHGILLVADEVQTGFGRTGAWFACEHEGVVPDIVATAKGLGGGLPIGGVTARATVIDSVHPGGLGGTFGGNPLACAAALAVIDTIESDGLIERAKQIGATMLPRLRALQASYPAVGDVRGRGAMVAIEIIDPTGAPDAARTATIASACHTEGLLVLTAGSYGNVLRFLPPLVIGDDLLDDGLSVLEKVFTSQPW